MKVLRRSIFVFVCALSILFSANCNAESGTIERTVKIYSFNIQIFGASKMNKPAVVYVLTRIVSMADIIAIQEVRSAKIEPVTQFMEMLPIRYSYVLGPREGRSSSKEQFWFIYDKTKFEVLDKNTYPDPDDIFERRPFGVFFKSKDGNFDFIVVNNHISPLDAENEISKLPIVFDYYKKLWNEPDVLGVGDFNADGNYYNENFLKNIFNEHKIIITNEIDTTIAKSDNTYDRFIITKTAIEDYSGSMGVLRFDEFFDFSKLGIKPKEVSDHYPVWAEFFINRDSD
jgi:endonuclease/exonuclease/phosphatase family metal-dependent hydrolase